MQVTFIESIIGFFAASPTALIRSSRFIME